MLRRLHANDQHVRILKACTSHLFLGFICLLSASACKKKHISGGDVSRPSLARDLVLPAFTNNPILHLRGTRALGVAVYEMLDTEGSSRAITSNIDVTAWEGDVNLRDGPNTITLFGVRENVRSDRLVLDPIILDRIAPPAPVVSPLSKTTKVASGGASSVDFALAGTKERFSVLVAPVVEQGVVVLLTGNASNSEIWSATVTVPVVGGNILQTHIDLRVRDRAGNVSPAKQVTLNGTSVESPEGVALQLPNGASSKSILRVDYEQLHAYTNSPELLFRGQRTLGTDVRVVWSKRESTLQGNGIDNGAGTSFTASFVLGQGGTGKADGTYDVQLYATVRGDDSKKSYVWPWIIALDTIPPADPIIRSQGEPVAGSWTISGDRASDSEVLYDITCLGGSDSFNDVHGVKFVGFDDRGNSVSSGRIGFLNKQIRLPCTSQEIRFYARDEVGNLSPNPVVFQMNVRPGPSVRVAIDGIDSSNVMPYAQEVFSDYLLLKAFITPLTDDPVQSVSFVVLNDAMEIVRSDAVLSNRSDDDQETLSYFKTPLADPVIVGVLPHGRMRVQVTAVAESGAAGMGTIFFDVPAINWLLGSGTGIAGDFPSITASFRSVDVAWEENCTIDNSASCDLALDNLSGVPKQIAPNIFYRQALRLNSDAPIDFQSSNAQLVSAWEPSTASTTPLDGISRSPSMANQRIVWSESGFVATKTELQSPLSSGIATRDLNNRDNPMPISLVDAPRISMDAPEIASLTPAMAVDTNNALHMAWVNRTFPKISGTLAILEIRYGKGSTTEDFQSVRVASANANTESITSVQLAVTSSGAAYVSYIKRDTVSLWNCTTSGCNVIALPQGMDRAKVSSLASMDDVLFISLYDRGTGLVASRDLKVLVRSGNTWKNGVVSNAFSFEQPSISPSIFLSTVGINANTWAMSWLDDDASKATPTGLSGHAPDMIRVACGRISSGALIVDPPVSIAPRTPKRGGRSSLAWDGSALHVAFSGRQTKSEGVINTSVGHRILTALGNCGGGL